MTRLHLIVDVPDHDAVDPTELAKRLIKSWPSVRLVHAYRDLIETQLDALEPHSMSSIRALFAVTDGDPPAGFVFRAPALLWMRPTYRVQAPWVDEFERLDFGGACTSYGMAVDHDVHELLGKLHGILEQVERADGPGGPDEPA